jgi:hypothetical protein
MNLPKVDFDPTTVDSNAFSLLGHFAKAAKISGWTEDQIEEVKKEAMSGDYDHLVSTIVQHCDLEESVPNYE